MGVLGLRAAKRQWAPAALWAPASPNQGHPATGDLVWGRRRRPWADRKTILSVGRFFAGGHNKRQDVVIDAFRQVLQNGLKGYDLALAGSIHPGPERRKRYHELRSLAEGLPCTFHPNVARDDLAALYERSAVLVHAAGYGVDPDEFPESLEHFGITPVEASSFGCIPVVYGQGGPAMLSMSSGPTPLFRRSTAALVSSRNFSEILLARR